MTTSKYTKSQFFVVSPKNNVTIIYYSVLIYKSSQKNLVFGLKVQTIESFF